MQNVLILSSVWLEPNSSAAGSRLLQLIKLFKTQNWRITYASTAVESDFAFDLSFIDVETIPIQINASNFDDFLLNRQPDIVIFDRFMIEEQFGWRVSEILPNTLRILDTEDLHCLRFARELALKTNKTFEEKALLKTDIAKREIASILRCDLSLIISKYEMSLLENVFKINLKLLHYIPFLLDEIRNTRFDEFPRFEERKHIYFVGNFFHKPNVDAVLYLKKEIWPILSKKLPNVELHIYGAYPNQKITQLHNEKERFLIKGRAKDINKISQQSKICLAPLRFGAGIKGKFIEAMQNGTPSVTTKIGSEAMHDNLDWSGAIANTINNIVNATVELYTNKTTWKKAQQNGATIINQCYNTKEHSDYLLQRIEDIKTHIEAHRLDNFYGAMLLHHTLKSTKYLSKWIEEKNKRIDDKNK
jgi:glycosyltransferase involved in cell wall biosynthesis